MSEAFHTDTRKVKKSIFRITIFLIIAFFICSLIGGRTLPESILYSFIFSAIFLVTLWMYGHFAIFGRSYLISIDGITLLKDSILSKHISWEQIQNISKGHLVVISKEKVKISFNLPPKIQKEAREVIKKLRPKRVEQEDAGNRHSAGA